MKKGLMMLLTFICLFTLFETEQAISEATVEMIPEEAIRLRILANSDTETDQQIKYIIRDEVNRFLYPLVKDATHIDESRQLIAKHLDDIQEVVAITLQENGHADNFKVEFREDVAFPLKKYGPYLYPAGDYEALLITIGDGAGDNWWCVLFPTLCYLDLSAEEKEEMEQEEKQEKKQKISFFLFDFFKRA